jgi:hypothetical protein
LRALVFPTRKYLTRKALEHTSQVSNTSL